MTAVKEAEGKLKLYFYNEDYEEAGRVVEQSFNVHHNDLLFGELHPIVNVLSNLGYMLKEEISHHDVVILDLVFQGQYSNVHVDVLKWFTENLDVFVEGVFHSDFEGEHEKWVLKGEENIFETVLYMRIAEDEKLFNQQAKDLVNHIANLDSYESSSKVYSVEELKSLIKLDNTETSKKVSEGFMLDLIYTGKLTLGFDVNSREVLIENFRRSEFQNLVVEGQDLFETIMNLFGTINSIHVENNERYPNIVEYSGVFESQTFKTWHLNLLEWLSNEKVGVYLDACDSFEDGILIECPPGSNVLTFRKTVDVDIISAAADYIRVNLLLELREHIVNEVNVESISLMFKEFEEYLEEAGFNMNFDHVVNIFTPLTLEN